MKLFSTDCQYIVTEAIEPIIETPLGKVITTITIDDKTITEYKTCTFFLESGARIVTFEHDDFIAELLICRPNFYLSKELEVLDCWAYLWRLKGIQRVNKPKFIVHWKEDYTWIDSGPNSGEHLDAIAFSNSESKVLLGTQDGEVLVGRAKKNELMPNKFDPATEPSTIVEYLDEGIEVPIPCLSPDELCQIQFLIAWNTNSEDEVGTWYAVDRYPKDILDNAKVK